MSATAKQTIKLKKLSKHNTTWHPESTLVFKSPGTGKDKVVIGRWIDEELIPLDEEAVTLCETWAFTPDPDLMGETEDEDGEDGEPDPDAPVEEEWGGATESDSEKGKEEVKEQVKEKGKEEVKEQVKENVKENVKEKVKLSTIATSFSSEVERLTQELSKEIIPIITKLEQELASTKEQLECKTEECKDYKQKFESINQKFEAMKSIFSPN
jgi:ankyrin